MNSEENVEKTVDNIIGGFFDNEKKNKLRRFKYLNQYIKKNQILFTGSSLMEHFPIEELRMSLDIAPIIYNRGIGGYTTDEFLEEIDTVLLAPEASKVFINIGTNDISQRFNEDGTWLEHLITNYDKILSQLKAAQPDCDVYLMTYYPANQAVIAASPYGAKAFGLRTPENMEKANQAVKDLAERFGYHFINVNEGLADADGELKAEYTTDGVHMIPDAYVQILHNMAPYL